MPAVCENRFFRQVGTIMNQERPIGISILSVLCILVGLLGLFAMASYFLIGSVKGELETWLRPAVVMLALCVLYLVLAAGLWKLRSWARWFAPGLLLVLTGAAMQELTQSEILDLAAALMFLLAGAANMAVIAWLRQPGVRELFRR